MQFTPGQHVISNGTLYIFRHDATHRGEPPRPLPGTGRPAHCVYAVVNLPGSNHPILLHRSTLQSVADTAPPKLEIASDTAAPMVDVNTSKRRPFKSTAPAPTGLDIIKADALDAQAERLEGYAKSLRSEARSLRGEG